jgi:lysozyme
MARRINAESLALIKRWEGLKLEAYQCPAGVWTIGYGSTRGVRPGQRITEAQAERLLRDDLARFEAAIERLVQVKLSDNQFGALVSWAFNVGEGAAARSALVRKLNAGDHDAVPAELARWNKVGKRVVAGLTNRRAAEAGLWARGAHVASASVAPEPAATTVTDAAATGTGRAALGVGAAGVLSTVSQHADAIAALGYVAPAVGVVLIIVAVVLFLLWRRGRL